MIKLAVILLFIVSFEVVAKEEWPLIIPYIEKFHFEKGEPINIDKTIFSKANSTVPLYQFICHDGNYDDDKEFDYSGLIHCRLKSLDINDKETGETGNLLVENIQATDWETRARFLDRHVKAGCFSYLDWGAIRRFSLRGMKLILSVSDPIWMKDSLVAFNFSISIDNDPNALTRLAQGTKQPEPRWFYYDDTDCSMKHGKAHSVERQ